MAKRARSGDSSGPKKKYKVVHATIDPNTSGIYATCARRHEKQASRELMSILQEKAEEYYVDELKAIAETELLSDKEDEEELSVEEQVQKELEQLKKGSGPVDTKKKPVLQEIQLGCECMVFIKTRRPIKPECFVKRLVQELASSENTTKVSRYVQRLTPITDSCNASLTELEKLCRRVLAPHFHTDKEIKYKFAVEVVKRNFNTIDKMDIIKLVAKEVGKSGELGHSVDLKDYDKLVIVQCYKNNIGMSVVDKDYSVALKKYNLQEIYDTKLQTKDA
ncbi:AFR250Cp [Eremothecium gossypii ATCC 10895]|uniref:AFR250Cp n=1 Tax=Eremothecium gossypii (strain ATCC 10895 / CBS 109.51 / FGSC 9923 / NRRL Y-1056) TaxID=284811 RepID=Q753S6_EREGS|nr:AFR250Cp [Eremothecium gossypii ATCC 10895]AAS53621.1 AFR250Cp [Eremothecium gossypii ATCC 10895]AEY97934.1 FAFR250Cp [Eremothecium gossypii FDAG1]